MIKLYAILFLIFTGCSPMMVDEYRMTRTGMYVYNTKRYDGTTKDIMINGDTLITTRDTIYTKHVFHPVPLKRIKPIQIY